MVHISQNELILPIAIFILEDDAIMQQRLKRIRLEIGYAEFVKIPFEQKVKTVKCTLFFSNTQLVLEIEDNGIGFDVEAVKNAGMSVGLRSMQTRLEHLGGHLHVQSEAGKTCLTACLPV